MEISIKTKNITLNSPLEVFIQDKIGSLDKFLSEKNLLAEVEISKTTKHHNKGDVFRAELQIELPQKLLRAESTMEDLRMAIVDVKDKFQVQIKKYNETK